MPHIHRPECLLGGVRYTGPGGFDASDTHPAVQLEIASDAVHDADAQLLHRFLGLIGRAALGVDNKHSPGAVQLGIFHKRKRLLRPFADNIAYGKAEQIPV
ncbi:hypothetical protein D3C75_809750 [compost metagenome]